MGQQRSAEHRDFSALAPELSQSLLAWWEVHGRKDPALKPWMFTKDGRWPEPHEHLNVLECWIAEVMLQQTQLAVVLPYWQRWMEAFPSLEALAAASLQQVRLQWQGLGYYSRARRLHESAQMVLDQSWPRDLEGWLALPGIGRTTAGGILSSAFNAAEPILDGNVRRVLARLKAHPVSPARDQALFWQWSEALLDRRRPRDFNQALMDLGATVCTPRHPNCRCCPWIGDCAAYAAGDPTRWPVTDDRKPLPFQVIGDGVLLGIQPLGRGGKQHVLMHAHALGITTRQQRRPRGRTHRRGHHEARKLPSFHGNAIDVRRLDRLRAKAAQIAVALIIGEDDHEVGLGGLKNSCGQQEHGQHRGFK